MICQDWANRSALLTNEQRGKSFRVLAEESYMTSEWRTIVALVVRTGPSIPEQYAFKDIFAANGADALHACVI
jgi:hypothetical protein